MLSAMDDDDVNLVTPVFWILPYLKQQCLSSQAVGVMLSAMDDDDAQWKV